MLCHIIVLLLILLIFVPCSLREAVLFSDSVSPVKQQQSQVNESEKPLNQRERLTCVCACERECVEEC